MSDPTGSRKTSPFFAHPASMQATHSQQALAHPGPTLTPGTGTSLAAATQRMPPGGPAAGIAARIEQTLPGPVAVLPATLAPSPLESFKLAAATRHSGASHAPDERKWARPSQGLAALRNDDEHAEVHLHVRAQMNASDRTSDRATGATSRPIAATVATTLPQATAAPRDFAEAAKPASRVPAFETYEEAEQALRASRTEPGAPGHEEFNREMETLESMRPDWHARLLSAWYPEEHPPQEPLQQEEIAIAPAPAAPEQEGARAQTQWHCPTTREGKIVFYGSVAISSLAFATTVGLTHDIDPVLAGLLPFPVSLGTFVWSLQCLDRLFGRPR